MIQESDKFVKMKDRMLKKQVTKTEKNVIQAIVTKGIAAKCSIENILEVQCSSRYFLTIIAMECIDIFMKKVALSYKKTSDGKT